MGALSDYAKSKKQNVAQAPKEPSFLSKVGSFAKELPSVVVRGLSQPVEFVEKTGATIGSKLADAVDLNLKVSPETKAKAESARKALEKPITLPYQKTPIIESSAPFKSVKEAVGSGVEAGANILLGLTGSSIYGQIGKGVAKQVGKEVVKKTISETIKEVGPQIAKRSLLDFGATGVAGAAQEAQREGSTTKSIFTEGLKAGTLGAALPPALGGATKLTGKVLGTTGKAIGRGLGATAEKLEGYAGKVPNTIETLFSVELPKPRQTFGQRAAEKTSLLLRSVQDSPNTFAKAINKYHPFKTFAEKAKENGIDAGDLEEVVQRTQHISAGNAENKLDEFLKMREPYGEDWGYVKKYAQYLDLQDRLARGNPIVGGKNAIDVEQSIQNLKNHLGEERWAGVVQGTKQLNAFQERELGEALASGRISKEAYDSFRAAHPNYTPHDVLDFLDTEVPIQGTGKNISLSKSGFEKAKGSTREIDDIDNAITRRLYRNSILNEKNKTMKAIIDVGKQNPEELGFIKFDGKTKPVDYQKAGFEKVSYYNNGVREDWLIPKDLGIAIKNLDGAAAGTVMRWLDESIIGRTLQVPGKIIKALATTFNPTFALYGNPARDIQTAMLTTKTTPLDFAKSFARGFVNLITRGKGDDELMKLARSSGALQGSIFREGLEPEEILKRMVEKDKHGVFFTTVRHPLQAVEALGQKVEEFTRMTVFKTALKNGATLDEAAKLTRNATVDFSRSGHVLQIVNKIVPFVNARVQGTANLVNALKKDPTQFYRRAMYTAAIPTAMLYQNNSKYESYQKIPDSEKRKFWIVMVGEGEGKDISGKKVLTPFYIKIPKGEAQQAISNVLERVMNKGKEKYPQETSEFLGSLIKDFSPITEANVLAPGVQQWYELKTNYSLFREKQIVPDYIEVRKGKWEKAEELPPEMQKLSNTSIVAEKLGKALGWSPIKIDYVIKTGVLNDFIRAIDLPVKGFKGAEGFQQTSELPFLRSIIGSSSYGLDLKKKQAEKKKEIEKNIKKYKNKTP